MTAPICGAHHVSKSEAGSRSGGEAGCLYGIPSFLALYINCRQSVIQAVRFDSRGRPGGEGAYPKPHASTQGRGSNSVDGSHVRHGGLRGKHGAGVSGSCLSSLSSLSGRVDGAPDRLGELAGRCASAGSCVNGGKRELFSGVTNRIAWGRVYAAETMVRARLLMRKLELSACNWVRLWLDAYLIGVARQVWQKLAGGGRCGAGGGADAEAQEPRPKRHVPQATQYFQSSGTY
jgi:hypothetical protein